MKQKKYSPDLTLDWTNPEKPEGRTLTLQICPFREYEALRVRLGGKQGLFPTTPYLQQHYEALLQDPVMQKVKDDYTYNPFSMEPDSILFLKEVIAMYRPQVVVELGSGISTPILSAAQKEVFKDTDIDPVYVTIDQSEDYLDQTVGLVEKAGTSESVKPLIFPVCEYDLSPDSIGQRSNFVCYEFDEEKLHKACGGVRPDMIVVDGPTGGGQDGFPFARMMTVPILANYAASEAIYFMDDAHRDTEFIAMQQWHQREIIRVLGLKMVGKGLMVGIGPQKNV